ncbi:MAG TPA: DUF2461 domain-containing protein [Candidatus Alistipes stercorigallinarum]|jgi:uncharacterized protein (TIGR02453 family)|nr:DUF2461 domain-containing protein [uncultured Alistipes sp.]HJC16488.1 DUF2461 domain-containing protein [Candidatus Alistipes stercorigallinarum]
MKQVIAFLRELHDNNNREWFDAHRAEWKRVKTRFAGFTEQLIDGISAFDPSVRGLRVQDCTYRIARDTRFSPDKTPYKEYIGAYIAPGGKKSGYAGYYFHVEPDTGEGSTYGHMLAVGLYCPEPVVLRSVRDEIFDNGAEVERTIREADAFTLCRDNTLRRTPKGYPSGSAYDELLRLRELLLERRLTERELLDDGLLERTLEAFRQTQPFVALLNRAVQFAYEEMR